MSTTSVVAPNAVYDGTPHGATAVVTGSGGLNQPLPVTYEGINGTSYGPTGTVPTNAGSYRATASFAGDATHSGSSDTETFTIAKAPSTTTTVGDGPFAYDGTAHFGGSGLAVGPGGLSTGATSLTYSGDQVNAGIYYVTAHYAGDDNHLCSDGGPVPITITPKDLDATGTTENTINIAKAGTITFTLSSVTGILAGDGSVYDLFNGATFWLRVGGESGTLYSVTSTATVLANGNIQISWRMSQELYNDLYAELGGATPSNKTLVDFFVRGVSNDGNYEITEDVFARIFQAGKVVFS